MGQQQTNQEHAYFAHSVEGDGSFESWELLIDHLELVSGYARGFASKFGCGGVGALAGLWHDLGKYRPGFQKRIRGASISVDHSSAGASFASSMESIAKAGMDVPLAFAIAGHHAGLANFQVGDGRKGLSTRLDEGDAHLVEFVSALPDQVGRAHEGVEMPAIEQRNADQFLFEQEVLTRFVFSALVDADRKATGAFYAELEGGREDVGDRYDSIGDLLGKLRALHDSFGGKGEMSDVNRLRAEVLGACIDRAQDPTGMFSLTAPTGCGKTLSAMRFALEHAEAHGLDRVIVVIPYTSIIEQNARVYRDVFGDENVLEHHSNLDFEKLRKTDADRETRREIAAENWDSPIVVTTSVQFFESLFTDHPSRSRKLHNIAKSVVILDEVQTLPPELLTPILDMLGAITSERYGCSVVLSTATPPSFEKRDGFEGGLAGVRPILDRPGELADRARRVRVRWEVDEEVEYEDLATRIAAHDQVLAIVHTRRDSAVLAGCVMDRVDPESVKHLSANMCPAHRMVVLGEIRDRLDRGLACRVVSTQLVEAGVDLDFPIVYRALAGLDSLAQAAGRCDREGKLTAMNRARGSDAPGGELVVFRPTTKAPMGTLRRAQGVMETCLQSIDGLDVFDPEHCGQFFSRFYGTTNLDAKRIQLERKGFNFQTVAERFKMIESTMYPIVIPYGEGASRIERYRDFASKDTRRALQPFTVQVSQWVYERLCSDGVVEAVDEFVDALSPLHMGAYDEVLGLDQDADMSIDPSLAII